MPLTEQQAEELGTALIKEVLKRADGLKNPDVDFTDPHPWWETFDLSVEKHQESFFNLIKDDKKLMPSNISELRVYFEKRGLTFDQVNTILGLMRDGMFSEEVVAEFLEDLGKTEAELEDDITEIILEDD